MTDEQRLPQVSEVVEAHTILAVRRLSMALFVDRSTQQWIVRDRDGEFWSLPQVAEPWQHRQPFQPTEDTLLEPVPGHYRYFLGVPA